MKNIAPSFNLGEIGQIIRAARKSHGLSQTQVSAQIAVSRKTLSSLEVGSINDIGVHKLLALCSLLNLELIVRERQHQSYPTLQALKHAGQA